MEKLVKQVMNRRSSSSFLNWPKDWVLKLLSVLFAVFLWYFVVGEDKVDTNVFVPVEIVNLPRDLVISNQYKKQLEVSVSGPRGLINGLSRQHVSRTVNLSKATPGTVVVRNEPKSISFPRGIRVLRIQPAQMTLLLDRLIEKDLEIKPKTTGSPAPGYELVAVQLTPASMTLSGPQAVLGDESFLVTEPINISGLKGTTQKQIPLEIKPAIADLIGEPVVSARVIIKEKTVEKLVDDVPVTLTHEPGDEFTYKLSPKTVDIKVKVPLSTAKSSKKLQALLQARVSSENLAPGSYTLDVETTAGSGAEIVAVSPKTVTLEIKEKKPAAPKTK